MKTAVFIAFVGLFFVFGCLGGGEQPTVTTTIKRTTVTQPQPKVTTTLKPDIQNFRNAVSGSDVNKCDDIEEQRLKDICIRDIAVKETRVELCRKIQTADLKDLCYYKMAVNTKDGRLCGRIGNDFIKQSCESKT